MSLGLFGKRKAPDAKNGNPEPPVLSRLQELTGNDPEMYLVMSRLLLIDPGKVTTTLDEAASQAAVFEAAGDKTRAQVWYRIAGGICLYKGDAAGVHKFFEKAASFTGSSKKEYSIAASRSQELVSVARKYYENI